MRRAGAIAMMSCLASTLASGTEYPSKPIRLVVPYAAGGSTDTVARIVGQQLSERVGQQVVIDNRTGAGTIIGTEIAAQAAPDGYTLLMATPPLAVNPALYGKVPYDLERDFAAGDTPAEFAQYLRHEAAKWGKVIKTAGIKPE